MMLQQEQIREVLARAEEIQQQSHLSTSQTDVDQVVRAAEEAGLNREAVLQAIRERLSLVSEPPQAGERVFAKSADGNFYPCEVVSATSNTVRVRFAKGGEHTVSIAEARPCSFMPGQRIVVPWPGWGWWPVTVVSYDAKSDLVKVTDAWSEMEFRTTDVCLAAEREPLALRTKLTTIALAAAAAGGAVGALVTWLMTR